MGYCHTSFCISNLAFWTALRGYCQQLCRFGSHTCCPECLRICRRKYSWRIQVLSTLELHKICKTVPFSFADKLKVALPSSGDDVAHSFDMACATNPDCRLTLQLAWIAFWLICLLVCSLHVSHTVAYALIFINWWGPRVYVKVAALVCQHNYLLYLLLLGTRANASGKWTYHLDH